MSNNTSASPKKKLINNETFNIETNKKTINLKNKQKFISQLSKQCNIMFQYMSNSSSLKPVDNHLQQNQTEKQKQEKNNKISSFYEILWKNKMIQRATCQFPQFNQNQLQKLIDRDWRVMKAQTKMSIQNQFQQQFVKIEILQKNIADFQIKLSSYS